MLNAQNLKNRIAEVLAVKSEQVQDAALLQELVVDSFILIDMVIDLQNTFGVRLNQEDLVEVKTVGDLVAVILGKKK
jgi:acyl carrier protein